MPELMTVREVADVLRTCTATVYRLIDAGRLPAVRVAGSMLRIRRADMVHVTDPPRTR